MKCDPRITSSKPILKNVDSNPLSDVGLTITKEWLIQLAKKHGVTDATKLESSQVTLQNFVFKLRENKYEVDEGFFIELADALGLQYIPRMD
ncbi:MAG: hypothetical protein QW569_00605, partial [Candidatus Bathyarchaeia archaeon]